MTMVGCFTSILAVLVCTLTACGTGDNPAQTDTPSVAMAKPVQNSQPPSLPAGSDEWWKVKLASSPPPPNAMSLQDAEKIHRYLDVGRFNSMGDQGMRWGTDYASAAKKLNIHTTVLKAADDYIHYDRMKCLTDVIKELLAAESELKPDYYHPIEETAFIGNYTVNAEIDLKACKDDKDLMERAKAAATRLATLIKAGADGFKIGVVRYNCDRLGTRGSLNVGFMWRRSDDKLREMPPWTGTYGTERAKDCTHWWSNEWNDRKVVKE